MTGASGAATPAASARTPDASLAAGRAEAERVPPGSLGDFSPSADRDPVGLLQRQNATRVPELVPVRHGRMLVSPFTFFRGAALPMAADLATMPTTGLRVQLCGDAHVSNFGVFGSPERRLVFDLNDFDETLPGPFEWDVRRLVASAVVAGRESDFTVKQQRRIAVAAARAYRDSMATFAGMPVLKVWYARLDVEDTLAEMRPHLSKKQVKGFQSGVSRARTRDSMQALRKLTTEVDGELEFVGSPPLVVPIEDLAEDREASEVYDLLRQMVDSYSQTLLPDRRNLIERFTLTRVARKVVGVGSVGTRAWILLMQPIDGLDPLLLQAKEANRSALADYLGESEFDNQGERVVTGQRLLQAATDVLLGWHRNELPGRPRIDYYVRQLRDWKFAVDVGSQDVTQMTNYVKWCAWTLARAHARTGDRLAIAAFLEDADDFDEGMADFASAYADVTERDHAAMGEAAAAGRIPVESGL